MLHRAASVDPTESQISSCSSLLTQHSMNKSQFAGELIQLGVRAMTGGKAGAPAPPAGLHAAAAEPARRLRKHGRRCDRSRGRRRGSHSRRSGRSGRKSRKHSRRRRSSSSGCTGRSSCSDRSDSYSVYSGDIPAYHGVFFSGSTLPRNCNSYGNMPPLVVYEALNKLAPKRFRLKSKQPSALEVSHTAQAFLRRFRR